MTSDGCSNLPRPSIWVNRSQTWPSAQIGSRSDAWGGRDGEGRIMDGFCRFYHGQSHENG